MSGARHADVKAWLHEQLRASEIVFCVIQMPKRSHEKEVSRGRARIQRFELRSGSLARAARAHCLRRLLDRSGGYHLVQNEHVKLAMAEFIEHDTHCAPCCSGLPFVPTGPHPLELPSSVADGAVPPLLFGGHDACKATCLRSDAPRQVVGKPNPHISLGAEAVSGTGYPCTRASEGARV